MSTFILSVDAPDDLRRFAEEVAPAVRELVEAARAGGRPAGGRAAVAAGARRHTRPRRSRSPRRPTTGVRLSDERVWDEAHAPDRSRPGPERRYTADEQAAGRHLIDVHDALRAELDAAARPGRPGRARARPTPAAVRSLINRMTIRQNNWTLGAYCESYCRIVTGHHTLEDRSVFPHLRRSDPRLARRDRPARGGARGDPRRCSTGSTGRSSRSSRPSRTALGARRGGVDLLTDALLSHLAYEERELVEPLARLGY